MRGAEREEVSCAPTLYASRGPRGALGLPKRRAKPLPHCVVGRDPFANTNRRKTGHPPRMAPCTPVWRDRDGTAPPNVSRERRGHLNHPHDMTQRALWTFVAAICLLAPPARAAWPSDALHPRLVCPSIGNNVGGDILQPDGAGGALVAWEDMRNGNIDPFAHHLRADGVLDPAWPTLGIALSLDPRPQQVLQSASDGTGGMFLVWMDMGSDWDIHAQHVLAGGTSDPRWPADGQVVSDASGLQAYPVLTGDGAGGVIIAWFDADLGAEYTLRLLADGSRAPGWPANGKPLCPVAGSSQREPAIVADGAGGAIVAWWASEDSPFTVERVYAQHLLADGSLDPAWPAGGRLLSPRGGTQENPVAVSDGGGGAIVAWQDSRDAGSGILAQHVLANGALDPAWPDSGRVLGAGGGQWPAIAPDGAGGAFVAWMDQRDVPAAALQASRAAGAASLASPRVPLGMPVRALRANALAPYAVTSASGWDIYAHHVSISGALDPAWPSNGMPVCVAARTQWFPVIRGDGAGSAYVAWQDFRNDSSGSFAVADVFVQHVRGGAGVDPAWPAGGLTPCAVPGYRYAPSLAGDGVGGIICAFGDARTDAPGLYAQHVLPSAQLGDEQPVPALAALVAASVVDGCVQLRWHAPGSTGGAATLYRRTDDTDWRSIGAVEFDGEGLAISEDCAIEGGRRYGYELGMIAGGSETLSLAAWIDTPQTTASSHLRVRNPVQGGMLDASFTLASPRAVTVDLFDVSGRRVASAQSSATVGEQRVKLATASSLEPGLYLVRVGLERPVSSRVVVIR